MKKIFSKIVALIIVSILLLNSCSKVQIHNFQGSSLGTYYSITYIGAENTQLQSSVDSILEGISHQFSIFDTTSIIYRINKGDSLPLTDDMKFVFEVSQKVSSITDGAFDITVAPIVNLWGFGKEKRTNVEQWEIDSVMQFVGFHKIKLQNSYVIKNDPRIQLNFNAIAKGFAVDKVAQYIASLGYANCIVDIGGEVVALGTKDGQQWQVGIQTPTNEADGAIDSQYAFPMKNKAVATSGNYRNYLEKEGKRYSHIISPKTGNPEKSTLLSVSVIAKDCVTADAYATAFMVLGMEKSLEIVKNNPSLAVYFIYDKNGKFEVKKSPNFP
ncbi:MAG: thiamine biosynthesis protein ApbE [Bacteroidetes bacterium HGW-Bacteroidetes-20]|nr:MAG: thiamine biosynthesis protein ApbE [Bacteroidetes bacterium HGW-Bacteroidetes-20]